jgi:hypothetical protein
LRREVATLPGVASNLVGPAYIAVAQDRPADASAILDQAHAIALAHGAEAVVRNVEEARAAT